MTHGVTKYSSLKDKDYEYMEFILRNGIVTAKQIMVKFREDNLQRVYRRLQKLQMRGYVKNERIAHKVGVYFCTHQARTELELPVTVPTKATLYTIQHELLLTDLVIYYELLCLRDKVKFRYQSERELRFQIMGEGSQEQQLKAINQNQDRIPDAIFYLQRPEGEEQRIWIELELNKKDARRYKEKFSLYESLLSDGSYDRIFYFAGSLKIKNALNQARQLLINADRIAVRDIPEDILEERWERIIPNGSQPAENSTRGSD